jgi:capsule polysaccharide export protein KpsE/RkpR
MEKRIRTIPYDVEPEPSPLTMTPLAEPAEMESEDRLLHIASLLWGERRLLRTIAIWAGVVTLLVGLFLHNTYRSTTVLMPPDDQSGTKANLAMMAGMASKVTGGGSSGGGGGGTSDIGMLAGDLLGMHNTGELFVAILRSHTAQENIVDQFDLTRVYGIPWLHLRARREDACKELDGNTEISQDRKSGTITIYVTDEDPKRSAALAAAYVDQLNRLLATLSTSAAGRERQFLEQRLVEVKKDLDQSMAQLSQFSSRSTTFDPVVQGKATVEAVAALEGELIAAESQLRGLQAIYTAENVRVRSLQARVGELRKQLGALSGKTGLDLDGGSADIPASEMPFPSLRELPLLGATYADLFRRSKIEETVYQVLTQQYELAKVQEAKEIPTVRVLDRAEIPPRKWGPHRILLALMGSIVGVLIGCLVVIGKDSWRNWDANEPRKMFLSETFVEVRNYRISRWMAAVWRRIGEMSRVGRKKWQDRSHNNGQS